MIRRRLREGSRDVRIPLQGEPASADLEFLFAQRAEELARRGRSGAGKEHLFFSLGYATFGLELKNVVSVIAPRFKAIVPGAPHYLSEVTHYRGKLLSLFRLDHFLGIHTLEQPPSSYLVLEHDDKRVGISVGTLSAIDEIDTSLLTPLESGEGSEYFLGVTSSLTLVLHPQRLFEGLPLEAQSS